MGGRPTEDLTEEVGETETQNSRLSVISQTDSVSTGIEAQNPPWTGTAWILKTEHFSVLVEEDPLTCEEPSNQQER